MLVKVLLTTFILICGVCLLPFPMGGEKYYVLFVDDFSRKVWVYVLKRKDDVFNTFEQFRVIVEKRTGMTIKCLRTDNGGYFTSLEF